MIISRLDELNSKTIVLGSGSARRKEILGTLGLQFQVKVSGFEEDFDKADFDTAESYVEATCKEKLLHLLKVEAVSATADVVICADTVVVLQGQEFERGWRVLEKPKDKNEAESMLRRLSGNSHEVLTAVAFAYKAHSSGQLTRRSFVEATKVQFAEVPLPEIQSYVASGEPYDKAGGYGIQGAAGAFVSGIEGCFFNVMGFPMHRFAAALSSELPYLLP